MHDRRWNWNSPALDYFETEDLTAYLFWIHIQVTEAHWTIRIERIGFSGETMQFDEHESQCNSVRVKARIRARCPLVHKPPLNSSIRFSGFVEFSQRAAQHPSAIPPHRLRFIPAIDSENVRADRWLLRAVA